MEELHIDRLSPVFFAWHDSGENPHLYSSDTYGQRTVAHYEIEYIVSSRSGYILTDSIPIPTEPQSVFFRFPGMVVEGIGVYRSLYVEFDLNETKDTFNAFRRLPPVLQNTTDSPADFSYFASLCLPLRATDAQKLLWKANILRLLAFLLRQMQDEIPYCQSGMPFPTCRLITANASLYRSLRMPQATVYIIFVSCLRKLHSLRQCSM